MAGKNIEFNISAQDSGGTFEKLTNKAKTLNSQLERANKLAGGIGGTQSGTNAARAAGYSGGSDLESYTMAGGVTGRGGASARDFANEAQGLGGLVRLYATYAANVFAVSAAFTALRESMATDIMIKGMEQLGAATGQSLGAMTKQFVMVTDGMISMREAAEAVTKASSSGLGRQQILELATVAKGASQALGVNMSDAVSRLSRGIVKLEPELLDELGLFTKTGKAAEEYARKVGKTESQLTDFERRQAFANAVLEEGRKKFGEIAQEGNPYDKLLASLKNVAQDILSIVNSIIGPVAKLLADNTGLITAAIGLAALKITQQAIPALGNWQKSMKVSAERAKQEMGELSRVFSEGLVTRAQQEAGLPQLEKKLAEAKKDLALQGGRGYLGKGYDPDEPRIRTAQQIALEEEKVNKHMERGNELQKQKAMKAQAVLNIEKEILRIQGDINKAHDYTQTKMDAEAKIFTQTWMMEKNLQNARSKYESADIRSRVSQNVYEKGTFGAIGELAKETMASKNMSGLGKASTIALGGVQALTQGIGILFNALSRFFGYLGIAYTVFEVLDSLFSTNSKSSAKFKDSLSDLEETTKTAIETNKKYEGSLSLEAAIAYANSLDGLTQSVKGTLKAFQDFQNESSGWDKYIVEGLKNILPGIDSMQEKLATQMGKSVIASIESLPVGEAREAFRKQIGGLLNVQPGKLTVKTATAALEKSDVDTINQVGSALEQTNKVVQESSTYLKGLKDSSDLAEKSMATFMNSMKDTSPVTTFFSNAIKYSGELNKALSDTNFNTQAAALDKLSSTDLSMFGNQALEIQKVVQEFNNLKPAYESAAKQLEGFRDKLDELTTKRSSKNLTNVGKRELDVQIKAQEDIIRAQETSVSNIRHEIEKLGKEAEKFIKLSIGEQVSYLMDRFRDQLAKIRLESQKDIVSKGFGDTISGTEALGEIAKQQIAIELRLITSQDNLADKIDLLRIQIAEAKDKEALVSATSGEGIGGDQGATKIQAAIDARALQKRFLESEGKFSAADLKRLDELAKIIPDNPVVIALLERKQRVATATADAAAKTLKVDFDTAIKKLDIEAKRQSDALKFEFDKLSGVIGAIGSDTPERLGAQLVLTQTILQEQYKIIDQQSNAALKRAEKAKEMALKAGQAPTQVAKQFEEKTGEIEKERSRSKELLEQKTILEEQARQIQYNLQIQERALDLEIRRVQAQKTAVIGTSLAAETERIQFDRTARALQDELQTLREISNLEKARRDVTTFSQSLEKKYGGEEAASREMTGAERAQLSALEGIVTGTDKANKAAKGLRGQIEGAARGQEIFSLTTKQINDQFAVTLALLEQQKNAETIVFDAKSRQLAIDQQRTDTLNSLGLYTKDELKAIQATQQIRQIELQTEQTLADLTRERITLEQALANAKRTAGEGFETDAGYIKAQQDIVNLDARRQGVIQRAQNAKELVEQSLLVPDRFQNFANKFEEMFNGMADAIVEWAKTGKANFKDVINTFLAEILRYEMRLQMHAVYVQTLRPLLGNFLSGLFSGGTSVIAAQGGGAMAMGGAFSDGIQLSKYKMGGAMYKGKEFSIPGYAKGGAMDKGKEFSIPGYAKGGMFTNQVVNKPTLFKAANGLGLMGEAGPEAIMPLSRMNDGELGVRVDRGEGSHSRQTEKPIVNLNVHNYSGQEVETKESVDSRGNVVLDVMIGNMVGKEITRPGAAPREAIANSFGLRPTLIKR